MNLNPLSPGFYTQTNRHLLDAARRDNLALADKWQDEASEAAVEGNPQRAGYIEWWIGRLA
jgi:hypothetical protein